MAAAQRRAWVGLGLLALALVAVRTLHPRRPRSALLLQTDPPLDAALDAIRTRLHKVGLFGLTVASSGEVCANGGCGERVIGSGEPLPHDLDTRFHWASMTKSMTATLTAIALHNSNVTARRWGATLGEVLPAARGTAYENATLRQLASHQAGLARDVPSYAPFYSGGGTPRAQRARCAAAALGSAPAYPVGTRFVYSNWGYILLGHVVEEMLDGAWEELLIHRLFEPLGVRGLDFSNAFGIPRGPGSPLGHHGTRAFTELSAHFFGPRLRGPAGTFSGSLRAMAAYLAWHVRCHNGEDTLAILPATACVELHTPAQPRVHPAYALGWFCARMSWSDGALMCQHSGTKHWFYTRMTIVPAARRAYLVGLNQFDPSEDGTDEEALDAVRAVLRAREFGGGANGVAGRLGSTCASADE